MILHLKYPLIQLMMAAKTPPATQTIRRSQLSLWDLKFHRLIKTRHSLRQTVRRRMRPMAQAQTRPKNPLIRTRLSLMIRIKPSRMRLMYHHQPILPKMKPRTTTKPCQPKTQQRMKQPSLTTRVILLSRIKRRAMKLYQTKTRHSIQMRPNITILLCLLIMIKIKLRRTMSHFQATRQVILVRMIRCLHKIRPPKMKLLILSRITRQIQMRPKRRMIQKVQTTCSHLKKTILMRISLRK